MTTRLYVVPFEVQELQIKAWCWGSCGDGIVGALDCGRFTGLPCRTAECPHLDKQMDEPFATVGDPEEPVYLRKLKDMP